MVDTVKFFLNLNEFKIDQSKLSTCLDDYKITTLKNGVTQIRGNIRNLQVVETRYVFQVYGSLPKFALGHNFRPLKISELQSCVEEISDKLEVPVRKMGISRLDIADNVELRLKPKYYLDCLFRHSNLSREPRGSNGVYFENKSRHITCYGKIEERLNKNQAVPPFYRDKNLLRIEHVHKRNVKYWFPFLDNIESLYDADNYRQMIDHWSLEFEKIEKVDTAIGTLDSLTDRMDYHRLLMLEGMKARGGELAVLRELETLYDCGKYEHSKSGRTKLRRHRKQVNELFEEYNNIIPDFRSLKDEIVEKVRRQAISNKEVLIQ